MTVLFAALLACAPDAIFPKSEAVYSTMTFVDTFGLVQTDERVRLERWAPVTGAGCDASAEVANYAGPDPMRIGFTAIFDAAGRGKALPALDVARQEFGVWWVDSADVALLHYLTEFEVTVVDATSARYTFEYANGTVGTMRDNGEPTFEVQELPVQISLDLLDGSVLDRGEVTDAGADPATNPETGPPICVR